MSKLTIETFTFNAFQENTVVVSDSEGNALIVDPGCYAKHEQAILAAYVEEKNLRIMGLINTHCHIDHVLGNHWVNTTYDVPLGIHADEKIGLDRVKEYAHVYGFEAYLTSPAPAYYLESGKKMTFGSIEITIYHTPGHSPGHVVFYLEKEGVLINGDVLFKGSFGRTDLPGGDLSVLKESIHNILFQFPNDSEVICGHGPNTTIGEEKVSNYILQF